MNIFRLIKVLRGRHTYGMTMKQETVACRFLLSFGILIGLVLASIILM